MIYEGRPKDRIVWHASSDPPLDDTSIKTSYDHFDDASGVVLMLLRWLPNRECRVSNAHGWSMGKQDLTDSRIPTSLPRRGTRTHTSTDRPHTCMSDS